MNADDEDDEDDDDANAGGGGIDGGYELYYPTAAPKTCTSVPG